MSQFINPYSFVPVTSEARPNDLPLRAFDTGTLGHLSHDRYHSTTVDGTRVHSGRLICALTAETAMVIGGAHENSPNASTPNRIHAFRRSGKTAIPGSALRGLISSIAEAASNSALRVLENDTYSRRADIANPKDRLDAIGMIGRKNNERVLVPLALPPLEWRDSRARIPDEYKDLFSQSVIPLRVYLDGYSGSTFRRIGFLRQNPDSYGPDVDPAKRFWYLKLPQSISIQERDNGFFLSVAQGFAPAALLKLIPAGNQQFVLGQRSSGDPISETDFLKLSQPEQASYTRGVLRVLGVDGREANLPKRRVHEVFLPFPPVSDMVAISAVEPIIKNFETLAKLRMDEEVDTPSAALPYTVKGSRRDPASPLTLRERDIVCFRMKPAQSADAPFDVHAIAISAIWRWPVVSTFDHFKTISSDALPMRDDEGSPRSVITAAEQIFGFVADSRATATQRRDRPPARAYASRVQVSDGVRLPDFPATPELLEEVILKVLASPKPPSPAMYFEPNGLTATAKRDLDVPRTPRGRKFYVHDPAATTGSPWRSLEPGTRTHLKASVRPLPPGSRFIFHIEFQNLSDDELGLLCYATRPTDAFRHKLGLGKPIGFGTVRIDTVGLFLVDRASRYTSLQSLLGTRYDVASIDAATLHSLPDEWAIRYPRESAAAAAAGGAASTASESSFNWYRDLYAREMGRNRPKIKAQLEMIGDPAKTPRGVPVMYPQVANVANEGLERESFKWFVANDRGPRLPLPPGVGPLPRHEG